MSQFYSRIHIKVSDPKAWEKLIDLSDTFMKKFGFDGKAEDIFDCKDCDFVYDDWSCDEEKLPFLIQELADRIGESCVIIADVTDVNVDPYTFLCYYLGDGVKQEMFSCFGENEDEYDEDGDPIFSDDEDFEPNEAMIAFCDNARISDFAHCINYIREHSDIEFSEKEISVLKAFGIE